MNALNPVLSIGSQLTDVLRAHRPALGQAAARARAAELLAMVGITADRLGSHPHQLSGGMRQRVMIAMALALRAADRDHGRADHRAGRGHPAGDPRGADGAARPARVRGAVHHPRLLAAHRDRGLDRGDVRGAAGGAGRGHRAVPRPPPPLQPRAAQLVPRPARAPAAPDRHPRLTARPAAAARRLRLPPALLLRHGPVPHRRARAAAAGRGRRPARRVLAAARRGARARPSSRYRPQARTWPPHRQSGAEP